MAVQQPVCVSRAGILQVLERTSEVCRPAFALISSDDARREGFFQRANLEVDKFEALRDVKQKGEKTREGVHLKLEDDRSAFPWLELYNKRFSVKAEVFFWTTQLPQRDEQGAGRLMPPFYPQLVRVYGIACMKEPAEPSKRRETELCACHISPVSTSFGGFLEGLFKRFQSDILPVQLSPFNNIPELKNLAPLLPGDLEDLTGAFTRLMRLHSENNHELARMSLNLLAEFEAMLASALAHLDDLRGEVAKQHAGRMVESFSKWVLSRG
ncbi:hypothetical protein HY992_06375 [Candidatus Micrarchaeota archaeon]|nr:hypothetical protein [Candidatus Micrarchaeota archaeon]